MLYKIYLGGEKYEKFPVPRLTQKILWTRMQSLGNKTKFLPRGQGVLFSESGLFSVQFWGFFLGGKWAVRFRAGPHLHRERTEVPLSPPVAVALTWCLYWVCYNVAVVRFWVFGHKACGILVTQAGFEPTPSALEGEVLTTGPPGKSLP